MKKNYTIVIIAFAVIIGFAVWGWKSGYLENQKAPTGDDYGTSTDIIYYYGKECPHCKDVADFLEENKISEKVDFSKREVWHNTKNKNAMEAKAKECNIVPEGMGVPFLYARGKCFIGTPNVIDFFKKEAGL